MQVGESWFRNKAQVSREQQMVRKFCSGSHRNLHTPSHFGIGPSPTPFRQVRSYRRTRPANLTRQTKLLFRRKALSCFVNHKRQVVSFSPDLQVLIVPHGVSPLVRVQAKSQELMAKSSSQNSSPATAAPFHLIPTRTTRQKSQRRTFRSLAFRLFRRSASLDQALAV